MSRTIDERVVSMQFDNSKFERNVSTTMSTLDKLKAKLNFRGASKGLEDINTAAKKVDLNPISRAVDTVSLKFSAMYTMTDQVFRNITNSAMMFGKKIVSALTIDPIQTGLSEYETKMNAVQVMKANTRGKYSDDAAQMEAITEALDELNTYADKTIYNFAQMTSNVGKFTAQGYDVKEAAKAVQGLANLAAASGASAEDMARATYQMSQAMGGTIRMIDWNSLRNANMATVELKNTLTDLARANGIAIDSMIEKHGTFEQTLQEGWLSGDLFTEAMNIYSGVYSEAELAAKGFTESQIANFMDLAKEAEAAATEVKTFTQLWGVLKETAQSGWTQTWEAIFGDFNEAKKLFTDLQNYFSDIINAMSDARNILIGGAFNITKPWNSIIGKLDASVIDKLDRVNTAVGSAADQLKYFQDIADRVWNGDYNNAPIRYELLENAGYDHRVVQELVNLGADYKLTVDDIEAAHKKFGLTLNKSTEGSKKMLYAMEKLSDEELRNAGLTEAEIKLFKDLWAESERTGKSIMQIVEEMSGSMSGREKIIDSFKNAWSGLSTIFTSIKKAWQEMFPPMTVFQLYNIIDAVHKFTEKLKGNEEFAEKVTRTFRGLFAIVRLITNFVGGALRIAFNILSKVLSYFNLDIWDATAYVGDLLVKFADFVDGALDLTGVLDFLVPIGKKVIDFFTNLINAVKESTVFKFLGNTLSNVGNAIKNWFEGLKEAENIPDYIFGGLVRGLRSTAVQVWDAIVDIGKGLIEKFEEVLGIRSPSRVMIAIGGFIIAGLLLGITGQYPKVIDLLKLVGEKIVEFVRDLDLGTIIAGLLSVGAIIAITRIANAIKAVAAPFQGFSSMCEDIGKAVKGVGRSISTYLVAKSIKEIAISIAILAASVAVLALLPSDKLNGAVKAVLILTGALAALSIVLGVLLIFIKKTGDLKSIGLDMLTLVSLAASLLIVAAAFKQLASINPDRIGSVIVGMTAVIAALLIMLLAMEYITKSINAKDLWNIGVIVIAAGGAIFLMAQVVKTMSGMSEGSMKKGLKAVALFGLIITAIVFVARSASQHVAGVGTMLLKMSVALGIMVMVVKMAAGLKRADVLRAIKSLAMVEMLFAAIILVSKFAGQHADKAGSMMLKMSVALLIMSAVIKIAAKITPDELVRSIGVMALFGWFFSAIIAVSTLVGKNAKNVDKLGKMLMSISVAMILLTGAIFILSLIKEQDLYKAVGCVALLEICFAGIMLAVGQIKNSKYLKGTLTSLIIALGLLSGVLIVLSFLDTKKVIAASASISLMIGMFALLMKMSGTLASGRKAWLRNAATIVTIGGVITGLAFVIKELAACDPASALGAAGAMSALILSLATSFNILSRAKSLRKGSLLKMLGGMVLLLGTIAVLGVIITQMNGLDPVSAIGSATALAILLSVLVPAFNLLTLSKSLTKSKVENTSKMLFAMSGCIAVLGAVLIMMSGFNTSNAITNATALAILLPVLIASFNLLTLSKGLTKATMENTSKMLFAMSGCIAVLGAVLIMMSGFNTTNAITNATALAILLPVLIASFNLLTLSKSMTANKLNNVATALGVMVLVLAGLGAVLIMMSGFSVTNAIPNAIALSILLPVLTLCFLALNAIGGLGAKNIKNIAFAAGALLILSVVLAALGGVLALMNVMQVSNAIPNALALAGLITVLSVLLVPLSLIGILITATGGMPLLGVVGLLTLAVPLLALVGILALMQNISNATENSNLLINLMTALTDCLVKISLVSPLMLLAIPALIGLLTVIGYFGLIVAAASALALIPGLKEFVSGGVDLLVQLAQGLGRVIGAFVTGIAIEVMTILPIIGAMMSAFMINAIPFVTLVKMVDEKVLAGVAILTGAIIALSVADFISGIISFMQFGSSFATLGAELSLFAILAKPFFDIISGLPEGALSGVKDLAEAMLIITGNDIISQLTKFITGGNSLEDFGAQLAVFGPYMKTYADAVKGIDSAAVSASAEAARNLAEMAKILPNSGGWMDAITGGNDIDDFGRGLKTLGEGLKSYGESVSGIESYKNSIDASCSAISSLAEVAETLPNSGGWMDAIYGENDIDVFGEKLVSFGRSLMNYGWYVNGIGSYTESINKSATAAQALSDMAATIPTSGVLWGMFGENDIDVFGEKLSKFGTSLMTYGVKVSDISSYEGAIKMSVGCTNSLVEVAEIVKNSDTRDWLGNSELVKFGDDMVKFADKLVNFGKKIAEISFTNLSKAAIACKNIAEMAKSTTGVDFGGLTNMTTSLGNIGFDCVNKFTQAFDGADAKVIGSISRMIASATNAIAHFVHPFSIQGLALTQGLSDGIDLGTTGVLNATLSLTTSATDELMFGYDGFYNAGVYLVSGFCAGINENTFRAEAKAAAMAEAAEDAAKEALDSHSPSRVFKKIGSYVPEGFAMGIRMFGNVIRNASTGMTDEAINTVKDSVLHLSNIIESDIDTQPTIRPVLDLSDVRSGAGELGSILGGRRGLGVVANVGGISTMMNQNRQNGGNDDVVSAINKLRADLSNASGDTYTFGDMTYDDGSNIANTLSELARAVKIERRR